MTCIAAAFLLTTLHGRSVDDQEPRGDPFGFFAPWVVVSEGDRRRLDHDEVLARTLSGKDGQIAVFVATRLNAQPDGLAAWTRAIAELKRSKFVLAIGRFSDPPALSDLDALVLDDRDLDAIGRCVPCDCGMKLSAPEIESLRRVIAAAGVEWRDAAQREFRHLLIERIMLYEEGGLAALPPTADRQTPRRIDETLSAIVTQSPYLRDLPAVTVWLRQYPHADSAVESFFYWSKDYYGEGKPVISVTHVGIVRPVSEHRVPAILVAGKQIFATHYVEAGLGLTMVLGDAADGAAYLVYVNRTEVDVVRGVFGAFARSILERRLKQQAPQIVRGLRARLESGAPPDDLFGSGHVEP